MDNNHVAITIANSLLIKSEEQASKCIPYFAKYGVKGAFFYSDDGNIQWKLTGTTEDVKRLLQDYWNIYGEQLLFEGLPLSAIETLEYPVPLLIYTEPLKTSTVKRRIKVMESLGVTATYTSDAKPTPYWILNGTIAQLKSVFSYLLYYGLADYQMLCSSELGRYIIKSFYQN